MKLSPMRLLLALLVVLFSPFVLNALTIKLASPLPEGTEWDNSLRRMADEWREITNGAVRVKIYPGGIAGNEGDMIRKMRIGQIDAGVFTAFGLKIMVPETFVITLPGLLRNDAEIDYVLDNFVERFDDRFRERGFEIIAWSKSGWAYVFANSPIHRPSELQKIRLAVDNSDGEIGASFKALGFNVVPVSISEIIVALQSGLVDSFTAPPIAAGAFQWFALAPYLTDYRLSPIIGGLVISKRTWSRIPEDFHDELKASMNRVARDFYSETIRLNEEAMAVMNSYGLEILNLDDGMKNEWRSVMLSGHKLMVGDGKAIPIEIYEGLLNELGQFRN